MIKKLLHWLLSFFEDQDKSKEQEWLEKKVEEKKKKLEEIDNEEMSDDDITDYLNK